MKKNLNNTLKITIIFLLLIICSVLTIVYQYYFNTDKYFTHVFYIPIVLSFLWYRGKGFFVTIYLAIILILKQIFIYKSYFFLPNILRISSFTALSFITYWLNERNYKIQSLIKKSLKEKEVLLKEVHHRVKNNLQVISSLIKLQSNKLNDTQFSIYLDDINNRVLSIALIHENLYRSNNIADIDFNIFINDFIKKITYTYLSGKAKIKYNININNVFLPLTIAVPCSLIINEILTNSIKYAFLDNSGGNIKIVFSQNENLNYHLTISDDGLGFNKESPHKSKSLGLELINLLVEQLNGKVEINSAIGEGTEFKITFPME